MSLILCIVSGRTNIGAFEFQNSLSSCPSPISSKNHSCLLIGVKFGSHRRFADENIQVLT